MNRQLKVSIIGASGIGKNHAQWFRGHGCEVCAFAGTSPQSVAATQQVLAERFGFRGRGYCDVEAMLRAEKPDAVCVASPPAMHYEHVLQCLAASAHVLCEKPLVYDDSLSRDELNSQAQRLVEEAAQRGVLLGTQMQYAMAADEILKFADVEPSAVQQFSMVMETKNLKPGRSHATIWIEMAPHPLSVLQKIASDAEIDEKSIRCTVRAQETTATFRLAGANLSTPVEAQIIVRCNPDANPLLRRFVINGQAIDYAGRKNEQGEFRSFLTAADGRTQELPDFVDLLIGNFVAACEGREALKVSGADGARNVAWMLQILAAGQRA